MASEEGTGEHQRHHANPWLCLTGHAPHIATQPEGQEREKQLLHQPWGLQKIFGSKICWGIRRKPISNELHTLTMLQASEKRGRGSREAAIQRESESRIGDIFGPSLTADPPSWRLDSSLFKTTMSFFEALLHCYLLFSTTSAIYLLSRASSNSKVFVILTTRASNTFCATATGNMIYRTWRFFSKFAPKVVFRSRSGGFLGTWTSVRTVSASLLASTITPLGSSYYWQVRL